MKNYSKWENLLKTVKATEVNKKLRNTIQFNP